MQTLGRTFFLLKTILCRFFQPRLSTVVEFKDAKEVSIENSTEEDNVHHHKNSQTHGADSECCERYLVPVEGEPPRHPAQQQQPEEEEGGHVEERVHLVARAALALPADDEELARVEKDRVDLCHEAEACVGHILGAEDPDAEAEDDEEVVNQELPGALLTVEDDHVQGVIDEVTNGEADKVEAEGREGTNEVITHLWGMVEGKRRTNACYNGMN